MNSIEYWKNEADNVASTDELFDTTSSSESTPDVAIFSGQMMFINLTKNDLTKFRIIPENGYEFITPKENGEFYSGDGFYWAEFTDEHYWYKVSIGGVVCIVMDYHTNELEVIPLPNFLTGLPNKILEELSKKLKQKEYYVGWKPKSQPHDNVVPNPFDK